MPAKLDRCVKKVSKTHKLRNAWAICGGSVGQLRGRLDNGVAKKRAVRKRAATMRKR